jgi:uncharacterized protein (DUF433 family)
MIDTQSLLSRITMNPRIMTGKPTIRGMRITVEQILRALASGVPETELLADYPELEADDFQAVLLYAADVIGDTRVFPVPVLA